MSDVLAHLYPSANAATEQDAQAAPNRAAESPPPASSPLASMLDAQHSAATNTQQQEQQQKQQTQPGGLTQQPVDVPPEPRQLTVVDRMYDAPLASPDDLASIMRLPDDPQAAGFDVTEEAAAERTEARSALHAVGLSRSEVEVAWGYAVRAAHPAYVAPDPDATEAALRQEWGGDFDRNLSAAKKLTAQLVERSPAIGRHLRERGLQNDISFVRAIAAAAKRRGIQ